MEKISYEEFVRRVNAQLRSAGITEPLDSSCVSIDCDWCPFLNETNHSCNNKSDSYKVAKALAETEKLKQLFS